ncbi:hydroxyacid dehydrogenase [bacterium]|nr:hydroxyacid dehydrogenase [bacterium]
MDVFFYEAFKEEAELIRQYLPNDLHAGFTDKTIQEYAQNVPAPIISTRTQSIIPFDWQSELTAILTRSAGFDHITRYLNQSSNDISCGYLPQYCVRAVAEQAMMLWTALLRKLPMQLSNFARFKRDALTGQECKDKTLLVVGVGNIGHEIATIGKALEMKVLGVDVVEKHEDIKYVLIDDGLSKANVIVCAMNLTQDNQGFFNYDLLKNANPNAVFVNIARGELSPSEDLLRLLNDQLLAGIGLDVYDHESELAVSLRNSTPSNDNRVKAALELAKLPQVILTPHNAFNTIQSVQRKSKQSIQQITHFLEHGKFLWPVETAS